MLPTANSPFSYSTPLSTSASAAISAANQSTSSTATTTTTTTATATTAATNTVTAATNTNTDTDTSISTSGPTHNHGNPSESTETASEPRLTLTRSLHIRGPSHDGQSSDSGNASSLPARDHASAGGLEDQRTKKRRIGPSTRGVANLTPEQLAKKRANDREAQRAIRERTRNQIETLEARIRELTSQQPYQELQAVIRAKEAVEAENAEIKSRLASIMSLIQPILNNPPAEAASVSPILHFTPTQTSHRSPSVPASYNASTPISAASPASVADSSWQTPGHTQPSPNFSQVKLLNQQRQGLSHSLDLGTGEQLKLDFLLDSTQRVNKMQTGPNGAQDTPEYHHLPMKHDWNAASFTPPQYSAVVMGGTQQHQQQRIEYAPQITAEDLDASRVSMRAPIKNSPPTCPLDSLLIEFLNERRQRAAEGVPARDVVGPRYPSVSSLLNPARSVLSHPLSKVFTDILAAFPGISTLPERVAVLYFMFLLMRWQISPTQENYDLLPTFARPTPAQQQITHPAWVDHIPFPRMREKLIKEYKPVDYLFDDFFIPFTTTISLNWPYEETDALLQSPDGGELLVNPVFERHMRRPENWTLGDAFDKAFPWLRGTYNLKRSGPGMRDNADGHFNGG
ncbi:uncharacterized protein GGS25DRAFT_480398 [Hypoxylon fragiforme]|uniref:uncharacterized protein n=1 Tax=Hypoxylon fragiforme TaxID=63214 RepID=UPI0020C6E319|nr:uncharacterized protein GGS25DRAFT_480398 [Hypoxylon fragiforme]KAI2610899.1 hypothetical protein GGS25DRAFT_480398 [Hypoxylon fragiforme]